MRYRFYLRKMTVTRLANQLFLYYSFGLLLCLGYQEYFFLPILYMQPEPLLRCLKKCYRPGARMLLFYPKRKLIGWRGWYWSCFKKPILLPWGILFRLKTPQTNRTAHLWIACTALSPASWRYLRYGCSIMEQPPPPADSNFFLLCVAQPREQPVEADFTLSS